MEHSHDKTTQNRISSLAHKPAQTKAIFLQDNRPTSILQQKIIGQNSLKKNNPTTPIIQRMKWRKSEEDLIPLDKNHKEDIDVSVSFPHESNSMGEGDVWDDKTGNVYDANTGKLKRNLQKDHINYPSIPKQFLEDLKEIEETEHTKLESKGGVKDYLLKINKLRFAIDEWLWGDDKNSPPRPWMLQGNPMDQSVEKQEGGYAPAAEHILKKLEVLKEISMIPEDSPKAPQDLGGKVALSHGLATIELLKDFQKPDFESRPKKYIKGIKGKEDETQTHEFESDQTLMKPKGEGMNWWASGAMGLAEHTKGSKKDNLMHLNVAGVIITIAIKPPNKANPEGEFIVLGVGAPLVHNTLEGSEGIQTPKSADEEHRVSYPAFIQKLKTIHSRAEGNPLMSDAEIAKTMLLMVKKPNEIPVTIVSEDLPKVAEALTTWMVAEPARHNSVIFNSIMALEMIASGRNTFEDFMKDDGLHPMSGGGTAKAGRTLRDNELNALKSKPVTDIRKASKTGKRQVDMLSGIAGKNLVEPLENILHTYAGKNVKIRYLTNDER